MSDVKYQEMKQRERDRGRSAHQHTSKKNREYLYLTQKSAECKRREAYIYESSSARDDTVLITTFKKKENCYDLNKSKNHNSRKNILCEIFQIHFFYIGNNSLYDY